MFSEYGIDQATVFNSYTGKGALHGLEFNDYHSFYDYTEAKKDVEQGQFYTPHNLSKFLVDCIKPSNHDMIADLTCGMGNFFNYLPNEINIYGNEIDIHSYKVSKFLYPQANLTHGDIRNYNPDVQLDLIIGNPPFNLKWQAGNTTYLSQLYYCIKANEVLKPNGLLAMITPLSFLNDEFANGGMIKTINSMFNFVCQFELPSNAFKQFGVSNFSTKIIIFTKRSEHITETPYNSQHILTPSLDETGSVYIYNTYISPIMEQKQQLKAKLILETVHQGNEEKEFQYKVNKLLFDIKRNPKINKYYSKAYNYYQKLHTQKQPEGMDYKEWQKVRITPNKVIRYLKDTLNKQHKKPESHITELVKTRYGLKLVGRSYKEIKLLKVYTGVKEMSFNDMILNGEYPFADKKYLKLFNKKKREYERQSKPFSEITYNSELAEWLDNLVITDHENNRQIKLNDVQKEDLNLILQKKYNFLQWDTGTGKSLAALTYLKYHLSHGNVRNGIIVAPAIAITGTFESSLEAFKIPFINIKSIKNINNIQRGQIAIITFNMLIKYQKQIKRFIKLNNSKIATVIDESDNICNISSKRSKACFNALRSSKYKLLTTATSVRNSIHEVFAEFSFLYGESVNFINNCKEIYIENKRTKELESKSNQYYLKPYPMYTKGLKLFKESHSPNKQTVFGLSQNTQNIYNSEVLKKIINKTIITRTFEDITNRSISNIYQHTVKFNESEYRLYKKVMEEFYSMGISYRTENSRKDAMLQILAQLNTLIKCCSASHLFKECSDIEVSEKFKKVFSLIEKWNDEHVVIGCRFKKTVYSYANHIKRDFQIEKYLL